MSQPIPLHLTLQIHDTILLAQIRNPGDREVRVWDLGNSWGGASWSLRLIVDGAMRREIAWRPTNQVYTRNIPRFIEVPPHGEKELRLTPSEWTAAEDLSPLRGVPIRVRVVLEIAPSPEAAEHSVATGAAQSEDAVSPPPHSWLFGDPTSQ
jgi:hypothetical protein